MPESSLYVNSRKKTDILRNWINMRLIVDSVKDLGVIMDSQLKFDVHVM